MSKNWRKSLFRRREERVGLSVHGKIPAFGPSLHGIGHCSTDSFVTRYRISLNGI
jgi:hypothetical protein